MLPVPRAAPAASCSVPDDTVVRPVWPSVPVTCSTLPLPPSYSIVPPPYVAGVPNGIAPERVILRLPPVAISVPLLEVNVVEPL